MYTSEDVNSGALYNLHYTGAAKKTLDSQEQYEALLNNWGFSSSQSNTGRSLLKTVSAFAQKTMKAVKSSFNMVSASTLMSKQHSANAHLSSH